MSELNPKSLLDRLIGFCLQNKLVVTLLLLATLVTGILVAPFDWELGGLPRSPVAVDAIPDIGENQQIIFTKWMGRSPQDVEDQISYPLTVSLLGIPGVKTIRSFAMFGFSSIYVIFKEDVEFYWSRSRILEKLNSLPPGTLPPGVKPALGPDATPLGQIYWYTLEGTDGDGNPTGGWDPEELRSIQDWYVRYGLMAADGVAEVASIGGFVKEYQIDVNPQAMQSYGIPLGMIFKAVKMSNIDVGARTIEINRAEYVIRGIGFIKSIKDIEEVVLKVHNDVPIKVKDVARVKFGPTLRRGALDKEGTEAVGGVVVTRYGANPLEVIKNVKKKIAELEPGLPKKTLANGTVSQVKLVPFYDRTGLIYETLGTLNSALSEEILITIIVILFMLMHIRSSVLISALLPTAVLITFIGMKALKVDANIVALSGIAIAIGTIVDMGIILTENMLKHLDRASPEESKLQVIFNATTEVSGAVLTAVATTIVGFLPVFFMEGAEGKLFKPLAYTKTLALLASIIVALTMIPPFAHLLFSIKPESSRKLKLFANSLLILISIPVSLTIGWWAGVIIIAVGLFNLFQNKIAKACHAGLDPASKKDTGEKTLLDSGPAPGVTGKVVAFIIRKKLVIINSLLIFSIGILLSGHWLPLGPEKGGVRNFMFVAAVLGITLGSFQLLQHYYLPLLRWFLANKKTFITIPVLLLFLGGTIWFGFDKVFGFLPEFAKRNGLFQSFAHEFPGLGKEFMPALDEGSYLFMPTTMPHASIGEALDVLRKQDMAITAIPEVSLSVGKIGRVESPLDPAPISMIETIINYKSEYKLDKNGHRLRFQYDNKKGQYVRDEDGGLVPDKKGRPFRQWRDHIRKPDDIWDEIIKAAKIPGTTSAPKLQPIAARIVMLQSGMRAPMGVKVKGPDLKTIEKVGMQIEKFLKQVPSVEAASVIADRIIGKPYLEIKINREAIARYGLHIKDVQNVIEVAVGGKRIMTTVEGRERYPVRVRYQRELRNTLETLGKILVPTKTGAQIPLSQLSDIDYIRGPQVIKSEDTFLTGYVVFDKKPNYAEVDVVEQAQGYLQRKIDSGEFQLPAGVNYAFAGSYENQIRAAKKLSIILPMALFVIFMILYFQFKRTSTTLLVFSGILVAWAGGFIMLYLYAQPWFLNFSMFGMDMQDLFQIHPYNLSIAVWVGFLALFGIASDNGVVICTYLDQTFNRDKPDSIDKIRDATLEASQRRIRPALMTAATTILALIPVLSSSGRGADVMVPMAIPSFGGMTVVLITVFLVPVLYCWIQEAQLRNR
ncbi:efflux RND transporter permease subunit [Fibrobacterota bacterium]